VIARFHGLDRVVLTLGAPIWHAETGDVHIREEAIMQTTIDGPKVRDRASRLGDLAEDAAFVLMLFSGAVIAVAIIALAIAI
jgi:hypothetical protein